MKLIRAIRVGQKYVHVHLEDLEGHDIKAACITAGKGGWLLDRLEAGGRESWRYWEEDDRGSVTEAVIRMADYLAHCQPEENEFGPISP